MGERTLESIEQDYWNHCKEVGNLHFREAAANTDARQFTTMAADIRKQIEERFVKMAELNKEHKTVKEAPEAESLPQKEGPL